VSATIVIASWSNEMNSFRFLEKAIELEIARQTDILENSGRIVQETRLYDADRDETRSMRSKEEANDYRYFPDPDLLPVVISAEQIAAIRASLPELPEVKRARFISQYEISAYDAELLTASRATADYFETVAGCSASRPKLAANWVIGELTAALNRDGADIADSRVGPELLAELLDRIDDGSLSGTGAKEVFEALWNGETSVSSIINERPARRRRSCCRWSTACSPRRRRRQVRPTRACWS
jgi:aspartyl-tRNA(Asn)/glutamyl-tRNA(Gln) amidotransferase subunit B